MVTERLDRDSVVGEGSGGRRRSGDVAFFFLALLAALAVFMGGAAAWMAAGNGSIGIGVSAPHADLVIEEAPAPADPVKETR